MAVHKVPLDVEADDKFLGPMSFKQFLFFIGAAISGYFIFLTAQKGVWPISVIIFFPFMGFAALAFPWSKEQPTEIWLSARLRFFLKPRKRVWNQSGVKDLVSITAPIKQIHMMTDGLNQTEVRSRFSALATMIDSRGWAVKNYTSAAQAQDEQSDRLAAGTVEMPSVLDNIADNTDDVLNGSNSIVAKQFDTMIQLSETKHKSETRRLIEEARAGSTQQYATSTPNIQPSSSGQTPPQNTSVYDPAKKAEDFWFMNQNPQAQSLDPNLTTFSAGPIIAPGVQQTATPQTTQSDDSAPIDENSLLDTIHKKQERDRLQTGSAHGMVLQPLGSEQITETVAEPEIIAPEPPQIQPYTPKNPDIMNLARNNDLNIATLAREANKTTFGEDEVVISLH